MPKKLAGDSGLPEETFYVAPETEAYFAARKDELKAAYDEWTKKFAAWEAGNADLAKELADAKANVVPDLLSLIPKFDPEDKMATRKAGGTVLQSVAKAMPLLISGSADLHGSTNNYITAPGISTG